MKPPRRYPAPPLPSRQSRLWVVLLPVLTLVVGLVAGVVCASLLYLTLGCWS